MEKQIILFIEHKNLEKNNQNWVVTKKNQVDVNTFHIKEKMELLLISKERGKKNQLSFLMKKILIGKETKNGLNTILKIKKVNIFLIFFY